MKKDDIVERLVAKILDSQPSDLFGYTQGDGGEIEKWRDDVEGLATDIRERNFDDSGCYCSECGEAITIEQVAGCVQKRHEFMFWCKPCWER